MSEWCAFAGTAAHKFYTKPLTPHADLDSPRCHTCNRTTTFFGATSEISAAGRTRTSRPVPRLRSMMHEWIQSDFRTPNRPKTFSECCVNVFPKRYFNVVLTFLIVCLHAYSLWGPFTTCNTQTSCLAVCTWTRKLTHTHIFGTHRNQVFPTHEQLNDE